MAQINTLHLAVVVICSSLASGCYSPLALSKAALTAQAQKELRQEQTRAFDTLQTQGSTVTLSVEQAMQLALESSTNIKVRQASLAFANAKISEATQIRNPEIRYSQEKIENGFGEDSRMDVEFRVRPPRPGELGAKRAIAQASSRSAEASLKRERAKTKSRVRTLFREIGFVNEEIIASKKSLEKRQQLVDLASLRTKRALGTQIDVALAQVAYHDAKQDLTELSAECDILNKQLLRLVGLPQEIELKLEQEALSQLKVVELAPVEVYIEKALNNRFELDIAASRIDAAKAQTYMQKAEAWPWFSHIKVGYEMKPGKDYSGAVTGGVALEIPLFSLNGGGIEVAQTRESVRRTEYALQVENIVAEVQQQYRQVQRAAQALITLRDGSKVAAEAATEAARAAMNAGQVVVQELALIEERSASTHRQWLRALRRYHRELTQLFERIAPID